jgi:hypothetical protein
MSIQKVGTPFDGQEWIQGFREPHQIPLACFGLLLIAISCFIITVVANKTRVEVFHEPKWAIIDGEPHYTHVISIHDSVNIPNTLPQSNHFSSTFHHFFEKKEVLLLSQLSINCSLINFGIMILDHKFKHLRHHLLL